jgi:hypothetical protein
MTHPVHLMSGPLPTSGVPQVRKSVLIFPVAFRMGAARISLYLQCGWAYNLKLTTMRKLILIGGIAAIVAGALIVTQRAMPNPLPAPAPPVPATGPTITWSLPQLTQTMFPGSSSTVSVSFRSDQNLPGVVVDVTPSLPGVISASPASFASITTNQSYQVALTLSAPPALQKRSFGGTIHLRNSSGPPKTYAQPLSVKLQTDWNDLMDPMSKLEVAYPLNLFLTGSTTAPMLLTFESSPNGVNIGGALSDTTSPESQNGFSVSIEADTCSSSPPFNISQWLSTNYPGSDIATTTPVTVGGESAYEIVFQNEMGAGQPLVVVYHNGFVYQISYASTFAPGSAADQSGLDVFNALVQHLTFTP